MKTDVKDARKMMSHHVYTDKGWKVSRTRERPMITVKTSVSMSSYESLGLTRPRVLGTVVRQAFLCDTGASISIAGVQFARKLGIREEDLLRVNMMITSADDSPIKVVGAVLVDIWAGGEATKEMVYICEGTKGCLLSLDACVNLGIIPKTFPEPGLGGDVNDRGEVGAGVIDGGQDENPHGCRGGAARGGQHRKRAGCDCSCPDRELPPDPPDQLPFPATPENRGRLEDWMRDRYAASSFNVCECQPLPMMHGEPLVIRVKEGTQPKASHSPIPVPMHWRQKVKAQLDRDVKLGVIEKVPSGTDTTWCHRMVIVPKKDGTPRRTVNFQPLNEFSFRQTHHCDSPFRQATSVPENTYKTVLDAWNGYHSVALDPECRHMTTFITDWGRYRYITMPQGYKSAGDAYTERFDRIVNGVRDKTKCVDDSLLWSNTLEEAFYKTCEYLTLTGKNGIIMNPKKFVFGKKEVEFAGFVIGKDTVKPSAKMLEAIEKFPEPRTITDVRAWFGLVNQVSPFFAARPALQPFRELLKSPGTTKKIYWDENLGKLFAESKRTIVEEVMNGIQTFSMSRPTLLATDWSKEGMGYMLLQKRCRCEKIDPRCCPGGWGLVLAGSRFCSGAESRYAPVEGEGQAIVW
ncbi:MAG: hypothetical protein GY782_11975, partial [Gammaproteobacteria bacterium]|nr:hypothetical protein [Gammaproteobacteria bacterium]